jgi:hypothetical protein
VDIFVISETPKTMLARAPQRADEHSETGRIDRARIVEIGREEVVSPIDRRVHRIVDLGRRTEVDDAATFDDVGIVLRRTGPPRVRKTFESVPNCFREAIIGNVTLGMTACRTDASVCNAS